MQTWRLASCLRLASDVVAAAAAFLDSSSRSFSAAMLGRCRVGNHAARETVEG